ncbi:hypothetical protein AVEN_214495-1 [Araneus ventricosus]|uniref:Uncharacterized protein n=1 Tax=Araneus ventricosus TaxID=182803 RepID=A0A4Y2CUL3_ARAVE|nr:hypothetical protein AVEN_214495-1 [Araneus ventricosus]
MTIKPEPCTFINIGTELVIDAIGYSKRVIQMYWSKSLVTLILAVATLATAAPFAPFEEIHKPLPYTFGYKIKDKHGEQHREETGTPLAVEGLPFDVPASYAEPLLGGAIAGYDSRFGA